MKKKVILCGFMTASSADHTVKHLIKGLGDRSIDVVCFSYERRIVETQHAIVQYISPEDPYERLPVTVAADAIFGYHWPGLLAHAKADAYIDGVTCHKELFDYICQIEQEETARDHVKTALQECDKRLLNSIYGTKNTRKHFICIATPSHRDISRYCRDLLECLRMRGIPAKINVPAGSVETDHVTTKMVTPAMIGYGLRCDECFGFRYEDARRLKRGLYPGYSELTSVTDYIVKIEKERKGEEYYIMNDVNITQELYKMTRRANFTYEEPSAKPTIEDVIFNDPATIVMWSDGTKTVVKAENEPFDPEKGLAMAISKKNLGNKHDYYITFKKYLKKYYKNHPEKHDKMEDYRPAAKAYSALMAVALTKGTKKDLEAAITEAIGYLGEALSE